MDPNFFKKLDNYKQSLTFDFDKRTIEEWEKSIRNNLIKEHAANLSGVKELLKQLKIRVQKCNYILQNDSKLDERERDKLFVRREEDRWLMSFFEDSSRAVASDEKRLEEELKL